MNYEVEYYQINYKENMKNGIGKLSWINIKSAIVYGLVAGLLAIGMYVIEIGSIFAIDWAKLADAGVMAMVVTLVSLIKNLLTTEAGNFLGVVKVIEK